MIVSILRPSSARLYEPSSSGGQGLSLLVVSLRVFHMLLHTHWKYFACHLLRSHLPLSCSWHEWFVVSPGQAGGSFWPVSHDELSRRAEILMIASSGSDLVLGSCCFLADFMMAQRCIWLSTNRHQNWLLPREFAAQLRWRQISKENCRIRNRWGDRRLFMLLLAEEEIG